MPCRLLNNIYGGTCIADRLETTLNIVVSRVTFLLFSSVGHFKSFRIIMTVPGVDLYSFITLTCRSSLHTLNVLYHFLNVLVACSTSILKLWSN